MAFLYTSPALVLSLIGPGNTPGGAFRHSEDYRTIFAADEVLYVLSGVMVLCNPATGEVQRVGPGEAAFFRRDTWHHAFNYSTEPLRVLEMFAPPPAQGTSSAYARAQPNLTQTRYGQEQWMGRWPMALNHSGKPPIERSSRRMRAAPRKPISPARVTASEGRPT